MLVLGRLLCLLLMEGRRYHQAYDVRVEPIVGTNFTEYQRSAMNRAQLEAIRRRVSAYSDGDGDTDIDWLLAVDDRHDLLSHIEAQDKLLNLLGITLEQHGVRRPPSRFEAVRRGVNAYRQWKEERDGDDMASL